MYIIQGDPVWSPYYFQLNWTDESKIFYFGANTTRHRIYITNSMKSKYLGKYANDVVFGNIILH